MNQTLVEPGLHAHVRVDATAQQPAGGGHDLALQISDSQPGGQDEGVLVGLNGSRPADAPDRIAIVVHLGELGQKSLGIAIAFRLIRTGPPPLAQPHRFELGFAQPLFPAGLGPIPVGTRLVVEFAQGSLPLLQQLLGLPQLGFHALRHDAQQGLRLGPVGQRVARQLIEEGKHPVEVPRGQRVVFVVVTLRARERQAQPDRGRGADALGGVTQPVFLGVRAHLGGRRAVAQEGGGHQLPLAGLGQQVPGQLLGRELIERQVAIEGVDDVVPVGVHLAEIIIVIAIRIRVARQIEPVLGHPFSECRSGQQPVHHALVCRRGGVGEEGVHLRRRRWQPGEIVTHAPQQSDRTGLRSRCPAALLQGGQNEVVHLVARPARLLHHRQQRLTGRRPGPARCPCRPFRHPTPQQVNLRRSQWFAALRRRHHFQCIRRGDAPDQHALRELAGHDHLATVLGCAQNPFPRVEPQTTLALRPVRPMTRETVIR